MSNASIAQRLLRVIAQYEREEAGTASIASNVELYEPAFENLPRDTRDKLHELSIEIFNQDLTPLEEETLGMKSSRSALNEMKRILEEVAATSLTGSFE